MRILKKNKKSSKKITMAKTKVLKQFQTIPGVGKACSLDFWNIGLRSVDDLKGQNPKITMRLKQNTKRKNWSGGIGKINTIMNDILLKDHLALWAGLIFIRSTIMTPKFLVRKREDWPWFLELYIPYLCFRFKYVWISWILRLLY